WRVGGGGLPSAHTLSPLKRLPEAYCTKGCLWRGEHICACLCVYVCVCVRKRERARGVLWKGVCMCVWVCVCERERDRERERGGVSSKRNKYREYISHAQQ